MGRVALNLGPFHGPGVYRATDESTFVFVGSTHAWSSRPTTTFTATINADGSGDLSAKGVVDEPIGGGPPLLPITVTEKWTCSYRFIYA